MFVAVRLRPVHCGALRDVATLAGQRPDKPKVTGKPPEFRRTPRSPSEKLTLWRRQSRFLGEHRPGGAKSYGIAVFVAGTCRLGVAVAALSPTAATGRKWRAVTRRQP